MRLRGKISGGLLLVFLLGLGNAGEVLRPAQSIYWHFTIKASWERGGEEWLWATMVEMPKEQAYAEEAAKFRASGGRLPGTILAQVRAAAFRSKYNFVVAGLTCHGRKAEKDVSIGASSSDRVFVHGQIDAVGYTPESGRERIPFHFGLSNQRVLMEDGRWRDIKDLVNAFPGPINVPGQPQEELRGRFRVQGINYDDPLVHLRFCEKAWAEQLETPLAYLEHDNIKDAYLEGPTGYTQGEFKSWSGFPVNVWYVIIRSTNREHPYWKQPRLI